MCWWQRYAHIAALGLAALAFTAPASSSPLARAHLACRACDRGLGRHRRLSRGRRSQDLPGVHDLHRDRARGCLDCRSSEGDHPRAAGPLRRSAMVVPRNFDGRVERDLSRSRARRRSSFCWRRRRGDEPLASRRLAVRPRGDAACRPGRRIWRDANLRGPARRAASQLPRSQARRADGGAGAAAPRPFQHAHGRATRAPDRASAIVERRRASRLARRRR